jgi:dihydrodipicolinate synthase/N-acetylneuraminate lyase
LPLSGRFYRQNASFNPRRAEKISRNWLGEERLFADLLAMGGDGVISGTGSVYPEPLVALYQAFQEGNLAEVRKQEELVAEVFDLFLNAGSSMAYIKAALKMRGIDVGHMQRPLLDLNEEERMSFEKQFAKFI